MAELGPRRRVQRAPATKAASAPHVPGELRGGQIGSLVHGLQTQLGALEQEVREDRAGAEDLRRHLGQLERERDELRKAVDETLADLERMEASGIAEEHKRCMDQIQRSYETVRAKHKEAVAIVSKPDTFAYHPVYKRHDDQFSGVHYTPRAVKQPEITRKNLAADKVEKLRRTGTLPRSTTLPQVPDSGQPG